MISTAKIGFFCLLAVASTVFAHNPQATVVWEHRIGQMWQQPHLFGVGDNAVLLMNGSLVAFDGQTGHRRWAVDDVLIGDQGSVASATHRHLAAAANHTQGINVTVYHPVSGQRVWTQDIGPVLTQLLACDEVIVVVIGKVITAYHGDSGVRVWSQGFNFQTPITCSAHGIFGITNPVQGKAGALVGIHQRTGAQRWNASLTESATLNPGAAAGDLVAVCGSTWTRPNATAYDARTGKLIFTTGFSDGIVLGAATVTTKGQGTVYVQAVDMSGTSSHHSVGNNYPGFLTAYAANASSSTTSMWTFSTDATMTPIGVDPIDGDVLVATADRFLRLNQATGNVVYEVKHLQDYNAMDAPIVVGAHRNATTRLDVFTGGLNVSQIVDIVAVRK